MKGGGGGAFGICFFNDLWSDLNLLSTFLEKGSGTPPPPPPQLRPLLVSLAIKSYQCQHNHTIWCKISKLLCLVGTERVDDCYWDYEYLLPTGGEEREVIGVGSIPVAIYPSCQVLKIIALYLHKHEYRWVVKIRNTSETVFRP